MVKLEFDEALADTHLCKLGRGDLTATALRLPGFRHRALLDQRLCKRLVGQRRRAEIERVAAGSCDFGVTTSNLCVSSCRRQLNPVLRQQAFVGEEAEPVDALGPLVETHQVVVEARVVVAGPPATRAGGSRRRRSSAPGRPSEQDMSLLLIDAKLSASAMNSLLRSGLPDPHTADRRNRP
jgi:hypothetical protein